MAAELDDSDSLQKAVSDYNLISEIVDVELQSTKQSIADTIEKTDSEQSVNELKMLQEKLQTIANSYDAFYENGDDLLRLMQGGQLAEAEAQLKSVQEESKQLSQTLEELALEYSGKTQTAAKQAGQNASTALLTMATIAFIAILISLVIGLFITRSILRQLGQILLNSLRFRRPWR